MCSFQTSRFEPLFATPEGPEPYIEIKDMFEIYSDSEVDIDKLLEHPSLKKNPVQVKGVWESESWTGTW